MVQINSKLRLRIISSLAILPLVLGALYISFFWLLLVIISGVISFMEWRNLCDDDLEGDNILQGVGIAYIVMAGLGFLILRQYGFVFALQIIMLVMISDIGAYAGGKIIGGMRLIPNISPNKTYAGLVCGWVLSFALGFFVFGNVWGAIVIAPLSQLGDIAVSALKRRAQVKDSGFLIPGHGGFLDRLDGYLLVGNGVVLWWIFAG